MSDANFTLGARVSPMFLIIIIIYIVLFSYSFIALYNYYVNVEPKS